MSSTLPSIFSSYYKCNPNHTFSTTQELNQLNDNHMHHGLSMWLGQEDYFFPFSNNFGTFDNFPPSQCTNDIDCLSNSNSLMEVISFGMTTSTSDYLNSHSIGHTNSSGSTTYDEIDSNAYNTLQNYVTSANNNAAPAPECWGFQGHTTQSSESENNTTTKVGRYSVEERKDRILRYLHKRNQRNFRKTIKYACRKTLADRRVRIRGRFAKNQEEQSPTNNNNSHMIQENSFALPFHNANYKNEECDEMNEEWLQEAMASLLYVPYISSWHPDQTTSFLSN